MFYAFLSPRLGTGQQRGSERESVRKLSEGSSGAGTPDTAK